MHGVWSPASSFIDAVTAISPDGYWVVGTYFDGTSPYPRAFIWNVWNADGSHSTDLGDLGDLGDYAHSFVWPVGVNDAGQVAGTLYTENAAGGAAAGATAFQWANGTLSALDQDGDFATTAAAGQDAQGRVTGTDLPHAQDQPPGRPGYPSPPPPLPPPPGAFFWSADAGLSDLGSLGGGGTVPFALASGLVTGTSYAADATLHLFSWQSGDHALGDLGAARLEPGDTSFLAADGGTGARGGLVTDARGAAHVAVADPATHTLLDLATLLPAYQAGYAPDPAHGQGVWMNTAGRVAYSSLDPADGTPVLVVADVQADADGDGLPDAWEQRYFPGQTNVDPNGDADGDGVSNLQEYENGTDPTDFYDGQAPVLTPVSGTPQVGAPGGLAPQALIVQVSNASGTPAVGAAVTFTPSAGEQLQRSNGTTPTSGPLALQTDGSGQATVFAVLPSIANTACPVTATVTAHGQSNQQPGQTIFDLSTDDGSGSTTYPSPFALSTRATFNADASGTLSWTQHLDGLTGFRVSRSDDNGSSWTTLATLPASSTGYTVPSGYQQGIIGYSRFRVQPLTGASSGNGSGAPPGDAGSSSPAAPTDTPFQPPARYAVIDLGLVSDVGTPQTINNNGTVLLLSGNIDIGGALYTRWRQGATDSFRASYGAYLDDLDNVAVTTNNQTSFSYGELYGANGSATHLAYTGLTGYMPPSYSGESIVTCIDNGTIYGEACYEPQANDPSEGLVTDGAKWNDPTQMPVELGDYRFDPENLTSSGSYDFVYQARNGIELHHRDNAASDGYFLAGAEMALGGSPYTPLLYTIPGTENSRGMVLASADGSALSLTATVNGVFTDLGELPFTVDLSAYTCDVAGFNAAQLTVTDAQGNASQVDAPQFVGNDTVSQGVTFVYEENPLSQTYNEFAANALLGGGSGGTSGGGGTPAVASGRAQPNAPNVDAGDGWSITTLNGINDAGLLIGTGVLAASGTTHAVLLLPVQFSVKNVGNLVAPSGFTDRLGTKNASTFQSQSFQATVTARSLPGLPLKLNFLQDIQITRTVTYEDGSSTTCDERPSYYPDTLLDKDPAITTKTDAQGNVTVAFLDAPVTPISASARPYVSKIEMMAVTRDFATLQLGSAAPQTVAELSWTTHLTLPFDVPAPMSGGNHFPTKPLKPSLTATYTPALNQTIYGTAPKDTAISARATGNLSNTYSNNPANWKPIPSSGSKIANQYPFPFQ